jgi:hypothetical protein
MINERLRRRLSAPDHLQYQVVQSVPFIFCCFRPFSVRLDSQGLKEPNLFTITPSEARNKKAGLQILFAFFS